MITASVKGRKLKLDSNAILTTGSVGEKVSFTFDSEWDGISKRATFVGNNHRITQLLDGNGECVIPSETISGEASTLRIGIYGTSTGIVIPTIWGEIKVYPGTTLGTNSSETPTTSITAQILAEIGDLTALGTEGKSNLVAAINELLAALQASSLTASSDGEGTVTLSIYVGGGS